MYEKKGNRSHGFPPLYDNRIGAGKSRPTSTPKAPLAEKDTNRSWALDKPGRLEHYSAAEHSRRISTA
jgi:hypothetical protein